MPARKYWKLTEVTEVCGVDRPFVLRLERAELIHPVTRRKEKVYPLDQVDRIRVARILVEEMGVNWEGVEVALHMREQMLRMQAQVDELVAKLSERLGD